MAAADGRAADTKTAQRSVSDLMRLRISPREAFGRVYNLTARTADTVRAVAKVLSESTDEWTLREIERRLYSDIKGIQASLSAARRRGGDILTYHREVEHDPSAGDLTLETPRGGVGYVVTLTQTAAGHEPATVRLIAIYGPSRLTVVGSSGGQVDAVVRTACGVEAYVTRKGGEGDAVWRGGGRGDAVCMSRSGDAVWVGESDVASGDAVRKGGRGVAGEAFHIGLGAGAAKNKNAAAA